MWSALHPKMYFKEIESIEGDRGDEQWQQAQNSIEGVAYSVNSVLDLLPIALTRIKQDLEVKIAAVADQAAESCPRVHELFAEINSLDKDLFGCLEPAMGRRSFLDHRTSLPFGLTTFMDKIEDLQESLGDGFDSNWMTALRLLWIM
jgi:hypothetical protein